jgi:gluconolactonase
MKQCLSFACVLSLCVACDAGSTSTGPPNTGSGGSSAAGGVHTAGGSAGAVSGAGAGTVAGAGGTLAAGGAGTAGGGTIAGSANAGAAGAAGASGGSAGAGGAVATGFKCPAAPGTFALPTGKAEHIAGTTPVDAFNMNAGFTNVEGPVWLGDSLYFSEMTAQTSTAMPNPPSRILKLAPGNVVSIAVTDSGSNGMATDGTNLFAAVHKDGSISQVTLPSGPVTPIVGMYMGSRFISPNDLAVRSDGTIYFSDPNYQNASSPEPQSATRLYRVTPPPTRTVTAVADAPMMPNGVTLSPDESILYVTSSNGFKKFAVMADGSLGPVTDFVSLYTGDGMAADCLGNLYVAGGSPSITVYSPAGASLGTIMLDNGGTTTNVAFGGTDHKTIYITAQGNDGPRGVFSIASSVPGFPY